MKQKLSEQEAQTRIQKFYDVKLRKKQMDDEFEKEKKAFYQSMGNVIDSFGEGNRYSFSDSNRDWKITRSVITKVVFDPDKLQARLGKRLSSQVIETKATIEDLNGLVKYLKTCGVDPNVFKTFISVQKTVDKSALDQLEALGDISKEDLVGTFEVTVGNPSFRVTMREDEAE